LVSDLEREVELEEDLVGVVEVVTVEVLVEVAGLVEATN
jgi:hypothetical protein